MGTESELRAELKAKANWEGELKKGVVHNGWI